MADEDLERARELLAKYANENECGWCQRQAGKLATAVDELRAATPSAQRFKDEVGQTSTLSHLDEVVGELKSARENQDNFRQRLNDLLKRPREEAPAPEVPTLEERSRELPRPRLPPGFVTPDDVARQRTEAYEEYKSQVNRHRGPVRDRIAFRAWQFLDRADNKPLRRGST